MTSHLKDIKFKDSELPYCRFNFTRGRPIYIVRPGKKLTEYIEGDYYSSKIGTVKCVYLKDITSDIYLEPIYTVLPDALQRAININIKEDTPITLAVFKPICCVKSKRHRHK